MTKTENILCCILRDSLSEQDISAIESMSSKEWSHIYELSQHNNIQPLLYHKIKYHNINLPREFEAIIRYDYLDFSQQDMKRKSQLTELIKIFNDHDIEHILLKGSHLAEKVYHNSVLRPMCDIDILIRKVDFIFIYETLKEHGYVSSKPDNYNTELIALNKHYPGLLKEGCLPVELHWDVHRQYDYKNIEKIWTRTENAFQGNLKTKILSPEELLIHICVHKGCDDNFLSSVLLLNDIKEILSNLKIDWEKLKEFTFSKDEWNNTKCVFSALYLCKKLLNVKVPESFLKNIRPNDFDKRYEELLIKQFFTYSDSDSSINRKFVLINKLRDNNNPFAIFKYLLTPKRICAIYNKKYSLGILPYLYGKRIGEKILEAFKIILGLFNQTEIKKLYAIYRDSEKIGKWLKR